jgi:hypothetical protein
MVTRRQDGWARIAALALLVAWLPCLPLGLCMRASAQTSSHGCCARPPAVRMAAAPQECWLQSPAPAPAGPPPSALGRQATLVAYSRPMADAGTLRRLPPTSFSPLAIVLRI